MVGDGKGAQRCGKEGGVENERREMRFHAAAPPRRSSGSKCTKLHNNIDRYQFHHRPERQICWLPGKVRGGAAAGGRREYVTSPMLRRAASRHGRTTGHLRPRVSQNFNQHMKYYEPERRVDRGGVSFGGAAGENERN